MVANDSKSYLNCLNKLVDECDNTYHHSIGNKLVDYATLAENLKWILNHLNFNMVTEPELIGAKIF